MKYKAGDVVRITSGQIKTATGHVPTMMLNYVGHEAVIEHVGEDQKLYQIRIIVPWIRGVIRFNAPERCLEPEITEKMLKAAAALLGMDYPTDATAERFTAVYQAMRAARFEEAK